MENRERIISLRLKKPTAHLVAVGALLVLTACQAGSLSSSTEDMNALTFRGLGPVKLGMTLDQAEHALGAKLSPRKGLDHECWYTFGANGPRGQVGYMMQKMKVVRIDVSSHETAESPVKTGSGFTVGSEEQSVVAYYGRKLRKTPNEYLGDDRTYLQVNAPNGRTALVFDSWRGKIEGMRVEFFPRVNYVDGCGE